MKQNQFKKIATIMVASALVLAASVANAGTYNFTQAGFSNNASVVGFFKGADSNQDGKIAGSEITSFGATFVGGYYDGFSFSNYSTSLNLRYTLGSGMLGSNNGDMIDAYVRGIDIGYYTGSTGGRMYGFDSEPVLLSNQFARVTEVTAVPEPETYAMMLAGLGMLGFLARRRNAKKLG